MLGVPAILGIVVGGILVCGGLIYLIVWLYENKWSERAMLMAEHDELVKKAERNNGKLPEKDFERLRELDCILGENAMDGNRGTTDPRCGLKYEYQYLKSIPRKDRTESELRRLAQLQIILRNQQTSVSFAEIPL